MIKVNNRELSEQWLTEYYDTIFQALSIVFDEKILETLRTDIFKNVLDLKLFTDINILDKCMFYTLSQRSASLIAEMRLDNLREICSNIIADLKLLYNQIGRSPVLKACTNGVDITLSNNALTEICLLHQPLAYRKATAPAYKAVLEGLKKRYREFDFSSYERWYENLKFQ